MTPETVSSSNTSGARAAWISCEPAMSSRRRRGGVSELTLLLSPDAFNFAQPVKVVANGRVAFEGTVEKSVATLLKWAARDNDRTMLFGAELRIRTRD